MTSTPAPVQLEHTDALYLRDVLTLTGRYLHNPYRRGDLAAGIAAHAVTAADLLTRYLIQEEDN